eukprot:snap_masked-scaffold_158-processed-gene-0.1-mRNA-1 protein AED:1.00 eAED:1.00 QI:0/0/0/0/1/1/2/0/161
MFRIFYLKRKGSGFYISKENVQDFIFQEKRFMILKVGIGLKMQLRALLSSAWLGGRGSRFKDFIFSKKQREGVQGFYISKEKGSRISDFLLRGWGFGFKMFSKKHFKVQGKYFGIGLKRWFRFFFKVQVSYFGIGLKMWLRAQFSSTWLGGRVQHIFQKNT